MIMKKFAIRIKADNDPNGNPQRAWIVWDSKGNLVGVYNEGYRGKPSETKDAQHLADIKVSKSEYHSWIREGREVEQ
jgi:hypothetical protein